MKPKRQRLKQPTPQELTDSLLDLLRRKFYAGDDQSFFKDRTRLLAWVVLWPATWLNERGVTIHGDAYRSIFLKVMLQANSHRSERITYRPAWLRMVIQSHFKIHGEEYYEEAKSARAIIEQNMLLLAQRPATTPDPVAQLALANQVLATRKRSKKVVLKPAPAALNLELNLG